MMNRLFTFLQTRRILLHSLAILFVTLLIASWLFYQESTGAGEKPFLYFYFQVLTGMVLFLIPPAYINLYWLIPRYLVQKRYFRFFCGVLLVIVVWGLIAGVTEPWMDEHVFGDGPQRQHLPGGFVVMFLMVLSSTLVHLAYGWFRQQARIRQMENDQMRMELSMLKNQVNPHFFFNTLNNLYALSLEQSAETPQVILKLSEMMRYTIYECKEAFVTIGAEVKYLENYLALEKIRQHDGHLIEFAQQVHHPSIKIAPMILIVFVENAFKHGVGSMSEGAFVKIDLKMDEKSLYFHISNNFTAVAQRLAGGVGLENVKRRLELTYPGLHRLDIRIEKDVYNVLLKIRLS